MNGSDVAGRLRAWSKGRPLTRGATLHLRVGEPADALALAFVRMGGESSPWGIAYGHPASKPTIVTVPEPRNRDLVADMVAQVAPVLLAHFRNPDFDTNSPDDWRQIPTLRRIWLPNPSHVEMLHFLNYTYTFTKWGPSGRSKLLRTLGRLTGWLFREARRPGQLTVMTGTDALRDAYIFPAEDVRQAHLGFLLAWLETAGGREARLRAAEAAEQSSIATSLDPSPERDELAPLVASWNEAQSDGKPRRMHASAREIGEALEKELERRYELVCQAIAALRSDKRRVNGGVSQLEAASNEELWYQYLRVERKRDATEDGPAFVPSPETDRYAPAAGARYFVHEASEELRVAALIHDDPQLQDEAVANGEALRGPITSVRDDDPGRALVPVWTVEVDDSRVLRVREGSWLCVAGLPRRTVVVRRIDRSGAGKLSVEIEVTNIKRKPKGGPRNVLQADDPRLVGQLVTLVPSSTEGMLRRKSQKVWANESPGAWLTHSKSGGPRARLPKDVGEDVDHVFGKQTRA